jgi:hypothetical protein
MLAADGCASSSSSSACCFCGAWAPGGPREWRSPCSGSHSFGHAHLPVESEFLDARWIVTELIME